MAEAERCRIEEAMRITGLPRRSVQDLSARGQIPGAAKLGRLWTFDVKKLRGWVQESEEATARNGRPNVTTYPPPAYMPRTTVEKALSRLERVIAEKKREGSKRG